MLIIDYFHDETIFEFRKEDSVISLNNTYLDLNFFVTLDNTARVAKGIDKCLVNLGLIAFFLEYILTNFSGNQ